MKPLKGISQKPQMYPFGADFLKKIHEGVFEHLVLKCTINRDVYKRTYLTGVFIQHLTQFWLGFLGIFFRWGVQNYTPRHYFR